MGQQPWVNEHSGATHGESHRCCAWGRPFFDVRRLAASELTRTFTFDLEPRHQLPQRRGLSTELFAARGHLFATGGGLLRDLLHRFDRASHLGGGLGLFEGRRGDLTDALSGELDAADDLLERRVRLLAQLSTLANSAGRLIDQAVICLLACPVRSASLRTSSATTAKPSPCSPARPLRWPR